jgi:hypothetical protein
MGRWIVIGVLAIVVAVGLGAYFGDGDWGGDDDGWRRNNSEVVTTADGQTIVIERDRHFIPFFIFIPFLILGFFWLFGGRRYRGNGWGGGGPDQHWLSEWHRREHGQHDSTN